MQPIDLVVGHLRDLVGPEVLLQLPLLRQDLLNLLAVLKLFLEGEDLVISCSKKNATLSLELKVIGNF